MDLPLLQALVILENGEAEAALPLTVLMLNGAIAKGDTAVTFQSASLASGYRANSLAR